MKEISPKFPLFSLKICKNFTARVDEKSDIDAPESIPQSSPAPSYAPPIPFWRVGLAKGGSMRVYLRSFVLSATFETQKLESVVKQFIKRALTRGNSSSTPRKTLTRPRPQGRQRRFSQFPRLFSEAAFSRQGLSSQLLNLRYLCRIVPDPKGCQTKTNYSGTKNDSQTSQADILPPVAFWIRPIWLIWQIMKILSILSNWMYFIACIGKDIVIFLIYENLSSSFWNSRDRFFHRFKNCARMRRSASIKYAKMCDARTHARQLILPKVQNMRKDTFPFNNVMGCQMVSNSKGLQ